MMKYVLSGSKFHAGSSAKSNTDNKKIKKTHQRDRFHFSTKKL